MIHSAQYVKTAPSFAQQLCVQSPIVVRVDKALFPPPPLSKDVPLENNSVRGWGGGGSGELNFWGRISSSPSKTFIIDLKTHNFF